MLADYLDDIRVVSARFLDVVVPKLVNCLFGISRLVGSERLHMGGPGFIDFLPESFEALRLRSGFLHSPGHNWRIQANVSGRQTPWLCWRWHQGHNKCGQKPQV